MQKLKADLNPEPGHVHPCKADLRNAQTHEMGHVHPNKPGLKGDLMADLSLELVHVRFNRVDLNRALMSGLNHALKGDHLNRVDLKLDLMADLSLEPGHALRSRDGLILDLEKDPLSAGDLNQDLMNAQTHEMGRVRRNRIDRTSDPNQDLSLEPGHAHLYRDGLIIAGLIHAADRVHLCKDDQKDGPIPELGHAHPKEADQKNASSREMAHAHPFKADLMIGGVSLEMGRDLHNEADQRDGQSQILIHVRRNETGQIVRPDRIGKPSRDQAVLRQGPARIRIETDRENNYFLRNFLQKISSKSSDITKENYFDSG